MVSPGREGRSESTTTTITGLEWYFGDWNEQCMSVVYNSETGAIYPYLLLTARSAVISKVVSLIELKICSSLSLFYIFRRTRLVKALLQVEKFS